MSYNNMVTPKIGMLHYNWHFEMLTPINLGSHSYFIWGGGGGGLPNELDNDGPSTRSPYDNEGRRQHDRQVPCPALRHPRLSPWTQLLNSANDQALIASCSIDFESFLTLLT